MTRRKQTIQETYSYFSRTFSVVCIIDHYNLYHLIVHDPDGKELERMEDMTSPEIPEHLERLKTKYILGQSELARYYCSCNGNGANCTINCDKK